MRWDIRFDMTYQMIYSNIWVNAFYSGAPPGHGVKVRVLWLKVTKVLAHVQTAAHIETAACPGVSRLPEVSKLPGLGVSRLPGGTTPATRGGTLKLMTPKPTHQALILTPPGEVAQQQLKKHQTIGKRDSGPPVLKFKWGAGAV